MFSVVLKAGVCHRFPITCNYVLSHKSQIHKISTGYQYLRYANISTNKHIPNNSNNDITTTTDNLIHSVKNTIVGMKKE